MLIAIISVYAFIIFPLFLSIKFNFDSEKKRVIFSVKLFNVIKVFSAELLLSKVGLILKISEKRRKIIKFSKLIKMDGFIKPFADIKISEIKLVVFKSGPDLFSEYKKALLFNYFVNLLTPIVKFNKPYLKPQSSITVYEGAKSIKADLTLKITFNFLVIIFTLIKSVWGKIYGK